MPEATPREKRAAARALQRLDISPNSLYRAGGGFKLLNSPPFQVRKIAGNYAVAVADFPPPAFEDESDDVEFTVEHPTDFCGELYAELISLDEGRVVGTCAGKVYYLEEMVWFFSAQDIVLGLDDEDVDCGALGLELKRRKQLRHLLTEGADTNLVHVMRLGVSRRHRGSALGLEMVKAVVEFAAKQLGCGYALMQPSPIRYEEDDLADRADQKLFDKLKAKLFTYYGRLGFERLSPRSKFMYRKLSEEGRLQWPRITAGGGSDKGTGRSKSPASLTGRLHARARRL